MPDSGHQAWLAVLDALEAGIAAPANTHADHHDDGILAHLQWQPPVNLGPIPPDLIGRAQRIREAQRHTIDALQAAVRDNRQHHALVSAVNASMARPGAVYLDVAG